MFKAGRASSIQRGSETSPRERRNEVSSSKEPAADTPSIVFMFHKEDAYLPPVHGTLCGFWWCCRNIAVITPMNLSSNTDVLRAVENAVFNYLTKPGHLMVFPIHVYFTPSLLNNRRTDSDPLTASSPLFITRDHWRWEWGSHNPPGGPPSPSQFVSHCWEVS